MKIIKEIIDEKTYQLVTSKITESNFFEHVYACDLLSAVIKHGIDSPVLITQIASITTLGVASMLDLPAVILTEGKIFDQETIAKANEEEIALIYTNLTSTEVILDLHQRNLI